MEKQKDRHLDFPGEANKDKHINFLAEENGNGDAADDSSTNSEKEESEEGDDNGFFTDDDNELQTKKEFEEDKGNRSLKDEKVIPMFPSSNQTLADKITVSSDNEDILTPVVNDDSEAYIQDDDQAH